MTHQSFHHPGGAPSYKQFKEDIVAAEGVCSPVKFVAAEAGFLPPGPLTFFADILKKTYSLTELIGKDFLESVWNELSIRRELIRKVNRHENVCSWHTKVGKTQRSSPKLIEKVGNGPMEKT